jgi:hypothetical protein
MMLVSTLSMIEARPAWTRPELSDRQLGGGILIEAEKGFEWSRPNRVIIAHGNAVVKQALR